MVVRAFIGKEGLRATYDETRSLSVGLGGVAKKAMEKSWEDEGEEGVTMMAGRGDFSVASGNDKSISMVEW